MKFVVSSTELLSHLQAISRVINSKNSLQILDNFLLSLEGNTLTMTASDIETTLITSMEVQDVVGSGKVAVANKLLLDTSATSGTGRKCPSVKCFCACFVEWYIKNIFLYG
ncbi:MAG: polymerase beta subunit [Bacteroidetes bacterium]|nr:polymerase beta subunit [Bacteroidota bacterium]